MVLFIQNIRNSSAIHCFPIKTTYLYDEKVKSKDSEINKIRMSEHYVF